MIIAGFIGSFVLGLLASKFVRKQLLIKLVNPRKAKKNIRKPAIKKVNRRL